MNNSKGQMSLAGLMMFVVSMIIVIGIASSVLVSMGGKAAIIGMMIPSFMGLGTIGFVVFYMFGGDEAFERFIKWKNRHKDAAMEVLNDGHGG